MKTTILFTLMLFFASCEEIQFDLEYSITEKISDQELCKMIQDQYDIWDILILNKNYYEAKDITVEGTEMNSITSTISNYEAAYNFRWFYQFDTVNVMVLQCLNENDNVIGAWVEGTYIYYEGNDLSNPVVTNNFFGSVVIQKINKDRYDIKLSKFQKGRLKPDWWVNETGNGVDVDDYYIQIIL